MTRKLVTADLGAVLDLVCREPSLNVWIIADIENYGLSSDAVDMWGTFRGAVPHAVLLRFYRSYVAYSVDRILPPDLIAVLREERPAVLSGAAATLQAIAGALGIEKLLLQHLAELKAGAFRPCGGPPIEVATATVSDAQELHDLAETVSEFSGGSVDGWRQRLSDPRLRTYFVRRDSRVVSTASTTTECSTSAMIGAVMTHPDHRGRGLASACMSRLCADLLASGKVCCLTYHNPSAGVVYERLGFRVVSPWAVAERPVSGNG